MKTNEHQAYLSQFYANSHADNCLSVVGSPGGQVMASDYAYSMRRVCVEYEPGTWMHGKERQRKEEK